MRMISSNVLEFRCHYICCVNKYNTISKVLPTIISALILRVPRSGDIVLAINSVPVSGLSFYQAAQLLRSCKNKVQLTVMNPDIVNSPPKTLPKPVLTTNQ